MESIKRIQLEGINPPKRKEGPGVVDDARAFPFGAMRRTNSSQREECLSVC